MRSISRPSRTARSSAAAALVAALALAPAAAHAQHAGAAPAAAAATPQNLLEVGRGQYDDLRYEEAIQTLSAAIIRRGNTPQSEIQLYELLGLSYLALNRNDEAEGAFRLMLQRDPDHQLSSDLAPRIIDFYNGVKQRWNAEGQPGRPHEGETPPPPPPPVSIEHHSPPQQRRNVAVDLSATLVDPGSRVARVVLAYRSGSHGLFIREQASREGENYRAVIPASAVRPPLVEYYFEALGADGVPIQARGDAFAPLRVAVPEPGGVPVWVWPVGGVVIAGAITAIVLAVVLNPPATGHLDIRPIPGS